MYGERRSWRHPVTADQLRSGDPYELSHGEVIECLPTGARGGRANLVGGSVLDSDPAVKAAGVDTGFSPDKRTMRAPDIAVGDIPDVPGWVKGAPPLAVEYADNGQDEKALEKKIRDLLEAGTQIVWVVRLTGMRRVEVHERGKGKRTALPGDLLSAPNILKNSIPVEALYDREAAHRVTLRNLLQREGFESLEAIKEQGELASARRSLRDVFAARGLSLAEEDEARIDACTDVETLRRWLRAAVTSPDTTSALS